MMYPRLVLPREFLSQDGVIFVSIDDNEVHNLRAVLGEVFGDQNFVANVIWQKKYTRANDATYFSGNHDFLVCFARDKKKFRIGRIERTNAQNKLDGGSRRFICIEMDESICRNVTVPRLRRAIEGFQPASVARQRETNRVSGLGGGFRFCRLGMPLVDDGAG